MSEPRIFVHIASYRDTECQWTVRDLFEKAANPDRISVGICWQYVPGEDDDCFQVETRPEQVSILEFHAKESRGVGWARSRSQSLWRDEDYTLQIDSHMRFVPRWDEILLEMHKDCGGGKAVLTTYPIGYEPPDKLSPEAIVTIYPKFFDKRGMIMFRSEAISPKDAPEKPQPTAFLAAGLLFGPSQINADAPQDPMIYFQGEEITLAARLWTHGWDLYTPNRVVAYHDYTKRPNRIRHWNDDVDWTKLNKVSVERVRHLLEIEKSSNADVLEGINCYSMGSERSLAAFEAFSKLDFKNSLIDGVETIGNVDDDKILVKQPPDRKALFSVYWKQNAWRNEETRSGDGSTLARTEIVRGKLTELFREMEIRVLVDACCGDFNWMRHIAGELDLYLGFDVVEPLMAELNESQKHLKNCFFKEADVVDHVLPKADAILVRDGLTHLKPSDAQQALRHFKKSGSRFLIATTHPGGTFRQIKTGEWYMMDLNAEPFSLPPPITLISEELPGSAKALGVWRLDDI